MHFLDNKVKPNIAKKSTFSYQNINVFLSGVEFFWSSICMCSYVLWKTSKMKQICINPDMKLKKYGIVQNSGQAWNVQTLQLSCHNKHPISVSWKCGHSQFYFLRKRSFFFKLSSYYSLSIYEQKYNIKVHL